jgi:hypothetical protein
MGCQSELEPLFGIKNLFYNVYNLQQGVRIPPDIRFIHAAKVIGAQNFFQGSSSCPVEPIYLQIYSIQANEHLQKVTYFGLGRISM